VLRVTARLVRVVLPLVALLLVALLLVALLLVALFLVALLRSLRAERAVIETSPVISEDTALSVMYVRAELRFVDLLADLCTLGLLVWTVVSLVLLCVRTPLCTISFELINGVMAACPKAPICLAVVERVIPLLTGAWLGLGLGLGLAFSATDLLTDLLTTAFDFSTAGLGEAAFFVTGATVFCGAGALIVVVFSVSLTTGLADGEAEALVTVDLFKVDLFTLYLFSVL
jgi:hypothetical protein